MAVIHDGGIMADAAIKWANQQQGKPYVWGATGPSSFDCSGLVYRAYEAAGYKFVGRPTTYTLVTMGDAVSSPEPGDLCLPDFGHIGICVIGRQPDGKFRVVEAPHTGDVVKQDWWSGGLVACRRLSDPANGIPLGTGTAPVNTLVAGVDVTAIQNAATSIGGAAAWLSNSHNWLRIGYVTAGSVLLLIALVAILRHSGSVRKAAAHVGKAVVP